jgi:hypothetical protein
VKITKLIKFPIDGLDFSRFSGEGTTQEKKGKEKDQDDSQIYDLYACLVHFFF